MDIIIYTQDACVPYAGWLMWLSYFGVGFVTSILILIAVWALYLTIKDFFCYRDVVLALIGTCAFILSTVGSGCMIYELINMVPGCN